MPESKAVKVRVCSPVFPHDQTIEISRVPCVGEYIKVLGDRTYIVIRVEHTTSGEFDAEIEVKQA